MAWENTRYLSFAMLLIEVELTGSQWYIFFLCGFGYLLDLLYAHAFALIAPALQQELGFSSGNRKCYLKTVPTDNITAPELGNIFSAFGAGLCAGVYMSHQISGAVLLIN